MSDRHVYFAQAHYGGPIKIGLTYFPEQRLKSVQSTLPFDLVTIGMAKGGTFAEKFLHCYFASDWIRSEWFKPSADLLRAALQARRHGQIDWMPSDPTGSIHFDTKCTIRRREMAKLTVEDIATASRCSVASIIAVEKRPAISSNLYMAALAACVIRKGLHWGWDYWIGPASVADIAAAAAQEKGSDKLPKKLRRAA